MFMKESHTVIGRMTDHRNDDYVPGTPEERICLVWPLTREIASLSVKHDAERRLQRHVTCIVRRERVRFILGGAYALAAHGYHRATMDIDTGSCLPLTTPMQSCKHCVVSVPRCTI
jgi:hypothetical protein